jgi:Methyltransferase domain
MSLLSPPRRVRFLLVALALALVTGATSAQDKKPESAGPYVPTPWVIVDEILKLGGVGPNDYVVDLGSGDGRLVLTAVTRFKARGGFGVDIEAPLVADANERARKEGVADRVKFHVRDLFETPVGEASVVTLYLLPTSVPKLEPKLLAELAPGSRVVSHDYPFPDWPHDRYVKLDVPEKIAITGTPRTTLYLYTVPARIGGEWELRLPAALAKRPLRLSVKQRPSGAAAQVGNSEKMVTVSGIEVHATDVTLTLPAGIAGAKPVTLKGKASDRAMEGLVDGARWRATRVGA